MSARTSAPTTITVSANPLPFDAEARYVDGRTAAVHAARLSIDDTGSGPGFLVIRTAAADPRRWPMADLRRLPDQADSETLVLYRADDPLTRLYVSGAEPTRILAARAPALDRRPPVRGRGRMAAWAAAAVGAVALILFVLIPVMADQLADYLPPEGEQALGDATFEQIREALSNREDGPLAICEAPAGLAALDRMERRLTSGLDLPYPVRVHVLDDDLVNAFALPGGRIILFRGLIEAATHPDQVAAVLAHELGHVVARDPTRGTLRSAGSIGVLGLLLGDFAGGAVVLFLANRLIEATYSQEAEAAADAFAHDLLARNGIAPSAISDMFRIFLDRFGEDTGIWRHFAGHPALGDRIGAAERADDKLAGPIRPSLGEEDWQALRAICR
ncbi:MAG: M48 family metallopeptidase [Paracoccaceae bacterium]